MNLEQTYNYMKAMDVIFMATIENDQPRVRLMALIEHERQWWCCTMASRAKIRQLSKNSKFEFCNTIKNESSIGSIRASGDAEIIEDNKIKTNLSKAIPFFKGYWDSPDDPQFALIRLNIEEIVVQSPFDKKFYEFIIKENKL